MLFYLFIMRGSDDPRPIPVQTVVFYLFIMSASTDAGPGTTGAGPVWRQGPRARHQFDIFMPVESVMLNSCMLNQYVDGHCATTRTGKNGIAHDAICGEKPCYYTGWPQTVHDAQCA